VAVLIQYVTQYPKMGIQRDRIEIINRILIETKIGLNKNQIMNKCNLNYYQTNSYLQLLIFKKMIVPKLDKNGKMKFFTTKKGKQLNKFFHELVCGLV
jgi:predicted transcriptional regulator